MPPSPKTIRKAAEFRAAGHSWEIVGKRLRRTAAIVIHWPEQYPEIWKDAYEQARRTILAEAEAEAICVLRLQLRAEDQKIRLDAARKLVDRGAQVKTESTEGNVDSPIVRIATQLEGLSDVELVALLDRLREATEDRRGVDSLRLEMPGGKA